MIVIGFVALEFVNYFFETKKHVMLWEFFKKIYQEKIKPRLNIDFETS